MSVVRGLAWPFETRDDGFPVTIEDEEVLRQSILQILSTGLGQRVMRPNYGIDAWSYIFESNDDILRARLRNSVRKALESNEPRIRVTAVRVEPEETKVIVEIDFIWMGQRDTVGTEFQRETF